MFSSEGVACLSSILVFSKIGERNNKWYNRNITFNLNIIRGCMSLPLAENSGLWASGGTLFLAVPIVLQQFFRQDFKRVTSSIKECCIEPYYVNKILLSIGHSFKIILNHRFYTKGQR